MHDGLGDRSEMNFHLRVYSFRKSGLFTASRKKSLLWEKNNRGKGVGGDFCMGISCSMSTMKGELNIPRATCLKPQVVKAVKARRWAAVPILLISRSECETVSLPSASYSIPLEFPPTDSFLLLRISFSFLCLFKLAANDSRFSMYWLYQIHFYAACFHFLKTCGVGLYVSWYWVLFNICGEWLCPFRQEYEYLIHPMSRIVLGLHLVSLSYVV